MTRVEALAVVGGAAVIILGLAWIAHRARSGGVAGAALAGAMAAYSEAGHTTAYEAHMEMRAQADHVASSEAPEDLEPSGSAEAAERCRVERG